jgi:hypothetical protein
MMVSERKSKYKTKVMFNGSGQQQGDMHEWCTRTFGPGGRNKHLRWRRGWTENNTTFYFRNQKDASMFILRWMK